MRGYVPPSGEDERLLVKRVAELVHIVRQRGVERATPFLSDREQELARSALSKAAFETYVFEGGHQSAERRVLRLCPQLPPDGASPFVCVTVRTGRMGAQLSHRDYLGAVLTLGIKRECLGDILRQEEGAALFALPAAARLICEELSSVGRYPASASITELPAETPEEEHEMCTASVSSLRLDALLAAMLHISRSDAVALVKSGVVEVNHVAAASPHYEVYANDVFSIRGRGKYKLCSTGAQSRKGRTFVTYYEY